MSCEYCLSSLLGRMWSFDRAVQLFGTPSPDRDVIPLKPHCNLCWSCSFWCLLFSPLVVCSRLQFQDPYSSLYSLDSCFHFQWHFFLFAFVLQLGPVSVTSFPRWLVEHWFSNSFLTKWPSGQVRLKGRKTTFSVIWSFFALHPYFLIGLLT